MIHQTFVDAQPQMLGRVTDALARPPHPSRPPACVARADFLSDTTDRRHFAPPDQHALWTLIGGTFGNIDPLTLFTGLNRLMRPGDLLYFDFNVAAGPEDTRALRHRYHAILSEEYDRLSRDSAAPPMRIAHDVRPAAAGVEIVTRLIADPPPPSPPTELFSIRGFCIQKLGRWLEARGH
ncbi:MAG: hypothetical protein AAGL98_07800, partial [Planctomycetota bacterium]